MDNFRVSPVVDSGPVHFPQQSSQHQWAVRRCDHLHARGL